MGKILHETWKLIWLNIWAFILLYSGINDTWKLLNSSCTTCNYADNAFVIWCALFCHCQILKFVKFWYPVIHLSVTGTLKGYDQLLNLVLDEALEFLRGKSSILVVSADLCKLSANLACFLKSDCLIVQDEI